MKLTTEHLRFYQAKKTPVPQWITKIAKTPWALVEPCNVSIHTLINQQVPNKKLRSSEPHNLIHLVKSVQGHKQETVREFLYRLATKPCGTDPKRRTGYARKWYAKLTRTA
jgi:hypothetical protein